MFLHAATREYSSEEAELRNEVVEVGEQRCFDPSSPSMRVARVQADDSHSYQ